MIFSSKKTKTNKSTTIADLLSAEKDLQNQFKRYSGIAEELRKAIKKQQQAILDKAKEEQYYEPVSLLEDLYYAAYSHHQDWVEIYYITLFCSDGSTISLIDKGATLFYLATSNNDPMAALIEAIAPDKTPVGKITYSYAREKETFVLDIFSGDLRISDGETEIHKTVIGFANLMLHPRGIKDWDTILNSPTKTKSDSEPLSPVGMIPFYRQLSGVLEPITTIPEMFFSNDPRDNSAVKLGQEMQEAVDAVDRAISATVDTAIAKVRTEGKLPTKAEIKEALKEEVRAEKSADKQNKKTKASRTTKTKVYDA